MSLYCLILNYKAMRHVEGRECNKRVCRCWPHFQVQVMVHSAPGVSHEHMHQRQAISDRFKSSASLRRSVCISRPLGACSVLMRVQSLARCTNAANRRVTAFVMPAMCLPMSFNTFPK